MTVEERMNKIEHLSAGWLEERKQDHEDYIRRWRDIQDNADATWKALDRYVAEWRAEAAARNQREEARWKEMNSRIEARDETLDGRIEKLVSAIGELIGEMRQARLEGK